jgi:hypothetical protein
MRRAILLALLSSALFAQQASIEGTVTDKVTHEPVSGVHITLITGVTNGVTGSYGAMSDRDGHFSILSIRPGTYIMLCQRAGYLQAQLKESGIPNLVVKPSQQLKDYKIEMTQRAIVSGRVLDENGDPVQAATLDLVAVGSESVSFTQMMSDAMQGEHGTDDRGEFRLTAAPGKYYVRATMMGRSDLPYGQNVSERRNDGATLPPYSPTFYPSTASKGRATVVEAIGGREVSGLDIRMTRQAGLTVVGIVTRIPAGDERPNVYVRPVRDTARIFSRWRGGGDGVGADGKFSFTNLEPGHYRVWAELRNEKSKLFSRTVELQLEGSDPPPLTLVLQPGADVLGTLVIEGDPPGAAVEKRVIRIGSENGETDHDNGFQLTGLEPNKYHVEVEPLPENAYVKSVSLEGAPAGTDNQFEIPDGASAVRIKVTVSRGGAQISGRVLDSDGNRLLTPLAIVALAESADSENPHMGEVKPDATYSLKGVRPGKYRLYAVSPLDMSFDNNADQWNKKLFERGEEIEVKAGDRITKDVKLLSKEDAGAKK